MQKFSIEDNGYNKEEVNLFITDVIKKTEGIIKKCEEQKKYINYLEAKVKKNEQKEEEIIKKAKDYASKIVNDALIKAERIENDRIILEKNIKDFKKRMNKLLQDENILLKEINELTVTDE